MRRGWSGLLGVLWLLAACGGSPETRVRVCGDLQIPLEADALRVSLRDEIFGELRAGVLELVTDEGVQGLPVTLVFPPVRETRWVTVEALLEGVGVVARFDRHTGVLPEDADVHLVLTGTCYRVTCPRGQTCLEDAACDTAPGPVDAPGCGVP